jgi:hypothetical protein
MTVAQGRSCPSCRAVVRTERDDCPACGEHVPFDAPLLAAPHAATEEELRARFPGPDARAIGLRMWIALALLVAAGITGAIAADGVLLSIAIPFLVVLFGIAYTGYRLQRPGRPRVSPADGPPGRDPGWVQDGPLTRWGRICGDPEAKAGRAFTPFAMLGLCTAPSLVPILEAAARVSHEEAVTLWDVAAIMLVLAAGVTAAAGYGQWYEATTVARYRYPD